MMLSQFSRPMRFRMSTQDMSAVWRTTFAFIIKAGLDAVYRIIVALATSENDIERMVRLLPKNCQLLPPELKELKEFWAEFREGEDFLTEGKVPRRHLKRLCVENSQLTEFLLRGLCHGKSLRVYYWEKLFCGDLPDYGHSGVQRKNLRLEGTLLRAKASLFGSKLNDICIMVEQDPKEEPRLVMNIQLGEGAALNEQMVCWFLKNWKALGITSQAFEIDNNSVDIPLPCARAGELFNSETLVAAGDLFPTVRQVLKEMDVPMQDLRINCWRCRNVVEKPCTELTCVGGTVYSGLTAIGHCHSCGGTQIVICRSCKDHRG